MPTAENATNATDTMTAMTPTTGTNATSFRLSAANAGIHGLPNRVEGHGFRVSDFVSTRNDNGGIHGPQITSTRRQWIPGLRPE